MKMGRPKKEASEKMGKITNVRLRDDERKVLEMAAARKGQTLSEWMRVNLLEKAEETSETQPELPFLSFEPVSPRVLTVDEIYENTTAELLTFIREDRRIERKPATIHAKELGEYFCMWANTASEGGLIAIGVSNDGKLDGVSKVSVETLNKLEKTGDTFCPDARYASKRVRFETDSGADEVLLIRIYYNDKKLVRTSDGRVFVRRGDSKTQLKNGEIRELEIDKGEIAWEQEDSQLKYPADFNLNAISEFANSVVVNRRLTADKSDEDVLLLRRLGRMEHGKFIPNKACTLLFANDPMREIPGCKIRFLRFDGKEEHTGQKWNAVKDETLEGNVPTVIIRTAITLDAQLREFSRLGKDGTFISAKEYPPDAWYEAIVNACCHRSYSQRNAVIFVKMFDDRLEIESPGGFMPFVNPATIYDQHMPRNPCLMDALFHLEYVKCAAEGTKRMRRTMLDAELPEPNFRQQEMSYSAVKVTLRNNIEQRKVWVDSDAAAVVGQVISAGLSAHEKRIINFVAEYKGISVSQTQRLIGRSWPSSKRLLDKLAEKNILEQHKKNPEYERDPAARYVLRAPIVKAPQPSRAPTRPTRPSRPPPKPPTTEP
jgi:ATP-dependent DNA helicase RecG